MMKRRSKYNNIKTKVGEITFDSIKESRRYNELRLLERAKKIKDLEVQPRFLLAPAFERQGIKFKKIEYVADFRYKRWSVEDFGWVTIVEDVKSAATLKDSVYRIKKKLLLHKYDNFVFREI